MRCEDFHDITDEEFDTLIYEGKAFAQYQFCYITD